MSTDKLNVQIGERLELLETEELRVIWIENNRALWSDQAFAVMEVILSERGVDLPAQQSPQFQLAHSEGSIAYIKTIALTVGRWTMLGAFLLWVLLLAPASELGYLDTPLNISFYQITKYLLGVQDRQTFQMLLMGMIDIKFLITCFGMIAGILMLMRSPRAIAWAKKYLLFMTTWVVMFMVFINVYPYAEIYWQNYFSVIESKTDWKSLLNGYAIKPGWNLLAFTATQFWSVFGCAIIWFLFFQRSTWVKERFCAKGSESTSNQTATAVE